MAIANTSEALIIAETSLRPNEDILETYHYPDLGYRTEVITNSDYRFEAARAVEIKAMVALGDPEDEVRPEFVPYDDNSLVFVTFKEESKGLPEDIQAMGRILPYHPVYGNKSLVDLADIPGWRHEDVTPRIVFDENHNRTVVHEPQSVTEAFQKEAGCEDITKVWDIATMAPNLEKWGEWEMEGVTPGKVSKAVINAFTQEVMCAWKRGELTHCTSMNHPAAHDFFSKKLGFPFTEMFGLGPIKYDNNGTGEGMETQPAWLSVADLAEQVRLANNRYFGELALQDCSESPVTSFPMPH